MELILVIIVMIVLYILFSNKYQETIAIYPTRKTVITPHYVHLGPRECQYYIS